MPLGYDPYEIQAKKNTYLSWYSYLWRDPLDLLSVGTYMCIYICLHEWMDVSIYLSIYLSIQLYIYPATYLPACISIYLSIYLSIYAYMNGWTCLCIYLSIYPAIYLSSYLPTCISLYLSIYLSIHTHTHSDVSNRGPCPFTFCVKYNKPSQRSIKGNVAFDQKFVPPPSLSLSLLPLPPPPPPPHTHYTRSYKLEDSLIPTITVTPVAVGRLSVCTNQHVRNLVWSLKSKRTKQDFFLQITNLLVLMYKSINTSSPSIHIFCSCAQHGWYILFVFVFLLFLKIPLDSCLKYIAFVI